MDKRAQLIKINKELKRLGYEDRACNEGLLSDRALLLMLDEKLSRSFSFGLD